MSKEDEQRIAAAIAWSLDNHQIPQSLINGDTIWNYSGSVSNAELLLYEENGPSVQLDRSNVIHMYPISPENLSVKYDERKWINGSLNGKFLNAIVFLHDNMKVSRVLGYFLDVSYFEVRVDGGLTYKVVK